ncbi:uncharacterized protein LOC130517150 isoform X1 [Takifugu flavidus]|uniref:uncharacterized protein LOC130517150 isoform X1 n=1 Tax=Takifugu flavidus TaxID=433684 RepID=UPI0025445351|nr:uncharacterized protein LOC130517150 isoform X1 [Takifugu flavidus]
MAAKMTTEVTVEVHHMPIYPVSADEFEGITLTQTDIDLLARAERLVSEDNQETEKAVKALLCSETPLPVQGTNCCVTEIGEIEIERETSALQHGTDSSKQTNKLSRRRVRQPGGPKSTVQEPSKQNLQTCASLSTVTPTAFPPSREPSAPARRRRIRQACTTLTPVLTAAPTAAPLSLSPDPFEPARPIRRRRNQRHKSNIVRRLFDDSGLRLNESVPEPSFDRVEGDTVGYIHSQQQHEHHESVRQPSFDRVEGDTGCYIHSQHPQDMVVLEIFNNVIRYIVSSNCNQRCTKTVLKKL